MLLNLYKAADFYKAQVEKRPVIYSSGGGQVGARKLNCSWQKIDKPTIEVRGEAGQAIKPSEIEAFDAGVCKFPRYYFFSNYGAFTLLGVRPDGTEAEIKLFDVLEEHDDLAFDPQTNRFAVKFRDSIAVYSLKTGFVGFHKIALPGCIANQRGNYSGIHWLPSGELEISLSQTQCETMTIGSGRPATKLQPVDLTFLKKQVKPRTVRVRITLDERSNIASVVSP